MHDKNLVAKNERNVVHLFCRRISEVDGGKLVIHKAEVDWFPSVTLR